MSSRSTSYLFLRLDTIEIDAATNATTMDTLATSPLPASVAPVATIGNTIATKIGNTGIEKSTLIYTDNDGRTSC